MLNREKNNLLPTGNSVFSVDGTAIGELQFSVILSRQYNYNVPTRNSYSNQAIEAPHLFIISYDIHDNSIGTNMTSDSIRFSTRTQIYCINLSSSTCHTYRLDAHGWHQQPQIKMPIGLASIAT